MIHMDLSFNSRSCLQLCCCHQCRIEQTFPKIIVSAGSRAERAQRKLQQQKPALTTLLRAPVLRTKKQTPKMQRGATSKGSVQASLAAAKNIGTATSTAISGMLGHPNLSQIIRHVVTLKRRRTSTRTPSAPVIKDQTLMATALT